MQKTPKMSISIYEPEITIRRDRKTGKRQISIPIAVAMDIQNPLGGYTSIDTRQSLKCSVDARWQVSDRFSIVPARGKDRIPLRGEVINKTSTASTQKSNILFRPLPLYEDSDTGKDKPSQTSYVAASALELSVPDAISQPSLCWNHYARSYTLDLSLTFHGLQGAPKYKANSIIPVAVTTQYANVERLKDQIVVGVLETHPDEMDDEDEDGELDVRRPNANAPVPLLRQGQRTASRTPPPAYFR